MVVLIMKYEIFLNFEINWNNQKISFQIIKIYFHKSYGSENV